MFRIRRIFDDTLPFDRKQVAQIQQILRDQFAGLREEDIAGLPDKLKDPLKYRFRHLLFAADAGGGTVRGFALVAHDPLLKFFYLDFIATGKTISGGGIGGALYERVREEARICNVAGVFFECLPDAQDECETKAEYRQNVARLRFYERYGARPIINTAYRKPIEPGDRGMPYLMFDGLDARKPPRRKLARSICRAILERKYAHLCSPAYVAEVVKSFADDPIRLRDSRYGSPQPDKSARPSAPARQRVALVLNVGHDIHHVRDRGYVEAPVRIASIDRGLEATGMFRRVKRREFSEAWIRAVHSRRLIEYLRRACRALPAGKSLYPYVFPIRNITAPPRELAVCAGYYCIDTFTPINANAFLAAKGAVDCTLTAVDELLSGERLAYALVRPPGHHAEHRSFGGFCYFNNSAIAAEYLSRHGRVAILDIDYHHGNGQQEIFYERSDVLTVSIHGHPEFAYPYFSGRADERGDKTGTGYNINYPLPEHVDGPHYHKLLERALGQIRRYGPRFLVLALGYDTAKADPTGTWSLGARDFEANGELIGGLRLPTVAVQEGGYRTRTLGRNARAFFTGLVRGAFGPEQPTSRRSASRQSQTHAKRN